MRISHVIRGEDHISNTPRQILIQEALGFERPLYAHYPLLLGADKSKLSKRTGDTSVRSYKENGYLPDAFLNYIAILGWTPKSQKEIMSLQEMIAEFDVKDLHKSGAVFDIVKLNWMNKQYIRSLEPKKLMDLAEPFFDDTLGFSSEQKERILAVEKERLTTLQDLSQQTGVYSLIPSFEKNLLVWKKADEQDALQHLQQIETILRDADEQTFKEQSLIEELIKKYIEVNQYQNGNVLWPLRVALSGKKESPTPFEILDVLGKKASLERIRGAIEKLSAKNCF